MELQEILAWSGGGLLLIFSFIKIPKIELNLWGWLAQTIGKAMNSELTKKVEGIDEKVSAMENKLTSVETTLNTHVREDKLDSIRNTRARILRFHDELRHGTQHTEEHYNEILSDIDIYEDFCDQHKDYPNTKAEVAISGIKESYKECIRDNSFLQ